MSTQLEDFVRRTINAAANAQVAFKRRPELVSGDFRGGFGEKVLRGSNLPTEVDTGTLGRHSILFGCLPPSPDVEIVRDNVRRLRNQAVVARSHLPVEQALDIQIWLVGSIGSQDNPEWRALALAIERDDRVARKLVWLPPQREDELESDFSVFIARTFLARPWKASAPQGSAQLDRLAGLLAVAADLGIESATLEEWFEQASNPELSDGSELVDHLVESWRRTSA